MASRDLNILVAAKGALKAAQDIGKVDAKVQGLGGTARRVGKGLAVGLGAAAGLGALVIGKGIRAGIESLADLESATTSVDGAIRQAGLTSQITAGQVAASANEIEAAIGAAFDDKDITRATGTLIRFGKLAPSNLRPAMEVMTDLAAKTGSVDGAATLLAKALADPTKAAGKLARAGVVLTKAQQKQITAMVDAGDAAGAQKVLLDALAKTTKGAAAASQGPYTRSLRVLQDVTEDAERALATGFLPVIEKVRDILTRELAKPGTLKGIEDFGKGIAGGLDRLVDIVVGLPWNSIKDAFRIMGTGSKALLDAFTGLPPWVQTAVITGWGLNKVSGGMLGSIVGQLGQGLIKGVLGMNAGVVNINAAVVNGAGGIPGGAVGGAAGGVATGLTAAGVASLAAAAAGLLGVAYLINPTDPLKPRTPEMDKAHLLNKDFNFGKELGSTLVHTQPKAMSPDERQELADQQAAISRQKTSLDSARDKIEAGRIATISKGDAIVSAIRNLDLKVSFSPTINVSTRRPATQHYQSGKLGDRGSNWQGSGGQ